MKSAFISGIPASGKSTLANRLAQTFSLIHLQADHIRGSLRSDPTLGKYARFFEDRDEQEYWETVSYEQHIDNLVRQCEALWEPIKTEVEHLVSRGQGVIVEGVNILPHLAYRDLSFPGIILLSESENEVFERLKGQSRWGHTEDLKRREAEMFFHCEGPFYEQGAKTYGYKSFRDATEAEQELLRLIQEAQS